MMNTDEKLNLSGEQITDQVNKSHRDGEYTLIIARSVQEVEKIRNLWKDMQPYPPADIDYFLTVVKSRQDVVRAQPYVILLSRDGEPETLLIGRTEDVQFKHKIRNNVLFEMMGRSLKIDIGGIVGNTSYANSVILISELIKSLKGGEADIAYFTEIPADSPIFQLAKTMPGFLCRDYFPSIEDHYKMTLPSSIDKFYNARKNKKRLRQIIRRLDREFSGNVSLKCYRKKDDVERFCRDAETIVKKTYQHALGGGFLNDFTNNFERQQLMSILAERGGLLAYILYIEDKPCAFESGVIYQNTYYSEYCGYDPQYKQLRIGTILMLKVIEDLCNDIHFQYIDFGWMDASYKRRFCDSGWEEASFCIFRPTLKGITLNIKKVLSEGSRWVKNIILTRLELKERWDKSRRTRVKLQSKGTL